MAPRPVATGTISFGLVSIPVRLYPATQAASAIYHKDMTPAAREVFTFAEA